MDCFSDPGFWLALSIFIFDVLKFVSEKYRNKQRNKD